MDGIIQGWGKHYRFCNDEWCFSNLDANIAELIRDYLGFYKSERKATAAARSGSMLGIEQLSTMERQPFSWPKTGNVRAA